MIYRGIKGIINSRSNIDESIGPMDKSSRLYKLWQLLTTFLKVGAIAFGGGYAVAPLLQKEAVEHRRWLTDEELTDIMGMAQALPGIIFTNSATIIGYRVCGLAGAVTATAASVAPTFILTLLVTVFFWDNTTNPMVQKALKGVLLAVAALVIYAITKMWKSAVANRFDLLLVLASSVCLILFKVNAALVILLGAIAGFSRNYYIYRAGDKKK